MAGELFVLSDTEIEELANKAGLSIHDIQPNPNNHQPHNDIENKDVSINMSSAYSAYDTENHVCSDFIKHFNALISTYPGKKIDLCAAASVSDRMFRHIKSGRHLRKEPILALLTPITT